ncbi:MAG: fused MFS/spermidine synthase, partial [Pseudomonadota bacterium]|nr:fused MFS/spermidine synthase [Pseudomonadota bacterium]
MAKTRRPTNRRPPPKLSPSPPLLVAAVGLNAAATLVLEIVAGRLLAPYFGMSLYTWTTVIGVVLSGLTLGHWLGGLLAERRPYRRQTMMGLAFAGGALFTLLVLPLIGFVSHRLL